MANGTKELHTSPITIEDEINEFSEKPVQGKTLYKRVLPDASSASAGDALVLDDDKNPTWGSAGGGGKYMHQMRVHFISGLTTLGEATLSLINDSNTPITYDTLFAALTAAGISSENRLPANGTFCSNPADSSFKVICEVHPAFNDVYWSYAAVTFDSTNTTFSVSVSGNTSLPFVVANDIVTAL